MKTRESLLQTVKYLPIYVACIAPAALLWQKPMVLTLFYLVTALGLLSWRHSAEDLIYFFVPFVFGPAGEFFAVQQGAWSYAGTPLIPYWLPFAWGIAGLFMKNLSEALSKLGRSRVSKDPDAAGRTNDPAFSEAG